MSSSPDLRFGHLAIKAGYLKETQLQLLLKQQAEDAIAGTNVPLGELCQTLRLMTSQQVQEILLTHDYMILREEDEALADLALKNRMVGEATLRGILDEQEHAFKSGQKLPPRFGDMLLSKGLLSREKLDFLLGQQADGFSTAEQSIPLPRAVPSLPVPGAGALHADAFRTEATGQLVQETGEGAGRSFPLGQKVLIGRQPTNEVPIPDVGSSRQHARIEFRPLAKQHILIDLNSANGTFLNDQPVRQPTPLKPGDRIRIGETILRYEAGMAVEADFIPPGATMAISKSALEVQRQKYRAAGGLPAPEPAPTPAPPPPTRPGPFSTPPAPASPAPGARPMQKPIKPPPGSPYAPVEEETPAAPPLETPPPPVAAPPPPAPAAPKKPVAPPAPLPPTRSAPAPPAPASPASAPKKSPAASPPTIAPANAAPEPSSPAVPPGKKSTSVRPVSAVTPPPVETAPAAEPEALSHDEKRKETVRLHIEKTYRKPNQSSFDFTRRLPPTKRIHIRKSHIVAAGILFVLGIVGFLFATGRIGLPKAHWDVARLTGTWHYEDDRAVFWVTMNPDGTWSATAEPRDPNLAGQAEEFRLGGTWKIQEGKFTSTVTASLFPSLGKPGDAQTFEIVDLSDSLFILKRKDGKRVEWFIESRGGEGANEGDPPPPEDGARK